MVMWMATLLTLLQIKIMSIGEDLLSALSELGGGVGELFSSVLEAVSKFFYTPAVAPDTAGSFTIVGWLTLASIVLGLCYWVLGLVLRLFKLKG